MDILGPLKQSEGGSRYIIGYVDRFIRYTIIDALPDKNTKTVEKGPDVRKRRNRGREAEEITEKVVKKMPFRRSTST